MDNHNEVIKFCSFCGNERVNNDYLNLYSPCKRCVARNSARYYQTNSDKINARSKLYQENTKCVRKSHTQQIGELKRKVEELIWAMEPLMLKNLKDFH